MTRTKITLAATLGVTGLSDLASSIALASPSSDENQADQLRQFLAANPDIVAVLSDLERKVGGSVI